MKGEIGFREREPTDEGREIGCHQGDRVRNINERHLIIIDDVCV